MVPLRNRRDCTGGGVRLAGTHRTARPRQPYALLPRRRSRRFQLFRTWLHAFCEAEEYAELQRWSHVPVFLALISLVLFVHYYLGTSRLWLLWTIILMRSVVLVVNFSVHPSFNFVSIDSLRRVSLLGEQISVIATAVPRTDWQMFALASLFLTVAYLVDTAVRRWRKGGPEARRKVIAVTLGTALPLLSTIIYAHLVLYGVLRAR